ncbi:MAG TPA: methyltransferase domain-containing protein [Candidatus Nanoarchaeia archaeon]|nr:methyltransferase domain-containing protein [Candidatus Nanoarchaeia archaeon]
MYSLNDVEIAYSNYIPSFDFIFALRKQAISELCLKKGDDVLDIACGAGQNFKHILQKIGQKGSLTAVDYSKAMLGRALYLIGKNGWKNIQLINADAAAVNYKEKYDAIISVLGFSSIPDHKEALKKAVNHLNKGGKLVILDGKLSNFKPLNILMPLLRWNRSWDKTKDIIGDVKKLFPTAKITLNEYKLGSSFIITLRRHN